MKRRRESISAQSTAFLRALYSLPGSAPQLHDDLAGTFVTSLPMRAALRLSATVRGFRALFIGTLRTMLGHSLLYIPLRTLYFDAVTHAESDAHKQLLILGAGYDCRALRLADAFRCCMEIDLPETQQRKVQLLAEQAALADGKASMLAADLRQPDWPALVRTQGLRPDLPTLILAEGLFGYMSKEELTALFEALKNFLRTETYCKVVFTYPGTTGQGSPAFLRLLHWLFRRSRERFRGVWAPAEMAAMLESHGFRVQEDLSFQDLYHRLTSGGTLAERWPLPFRTATATWVAGRRCLPQDATQGLYVG